MIEAHNQEMRTLKNKTDAGLEFMKQEHSLAAAKVLYHLNFHIFM